MELPPDRSQFHGSEPRRTAVGDDIEKSLPTQSSSRKVVNIAPVYPDCFTSPSSVKTHRKRPNPVDKSRASSPGRDAAAVGGAPHRYGTRLATGARQKKIASGSVVGMIPPTPPQYDRLTKARTSGAMHGCFKEQPMVRHQPEFPSTDVTGQAAAAGAPLPSPPSRTAKEKKVRNPADNPNRAFSGTSVVAPACQTTSEAKIATRGGLPAAWTTASTLGILPPSGGSLGYSRRPRSRLSLKRSRPLPLQHDTQAGGAVAGEGGTPDLATHGFLLGASSQRQLGLPPDQTPHKIPRPGANERHLNVMSFGSPSSASRNVRLYPVDGSIPGSTPPPPLPRPPPYVGLKNMGNTCYINAVVQALLACPGVVARLRVVTGRAPTVSCNGDQSALLQKADGRSGPPRTDAALRGQKDEVAMGRIRGSVVGRTDGGIVLNELAGLLMLMEERNLELAYSGDCGVNHPAIQTSFSEASRSADSHSMMCGDTGGGNDSNAAGWETATALSDQRRSCAIPSTRPMVSERSSYCEALTPTSVVELVRGGRLGAGSMASTSRTDWHVQCGGFAGGAAVPGFGSGQQCVSELLGKILDVKVGGHEKKLETRADTGNEEYGHDTDSHGRGTGEREESLGTEFGGKLCVRTLCLECERDRVNEELFTELTLPSLIRQPLSLPNGEWREEHENQNNSAPVEPRTLQALVEMVLGSESLGGANKVWCESCRQWTEAERRSSLHSLPALLVFHLRPATVEHGWIHPSPGADCRSLDGKVLPSYSGGCGGVYKAGHTINEQDGALIDRRLTVSASLRCQFHTTVGKRGDDGQVFGSISGHERSDRAKRTRVEQNIATETFLSPRPTGDDVRYDLVGIILHQGQTLGSGHYTFARHVSESSSEQDGDRPGLIAASSPTASNHVISDCANLPKKSVVKGSGTEALTKVAAAVTKKVEQASPQRCLSDVAEKQSSSRFVLFDDDQVRWLSPGESDAVLRGGVGVNGVSVSGGDDGCGDAFLVFYARH